MKLYGHPGSTCTRKILTILAERNAPFELVQVELGKGEHKQAEHLARQPFGQIPAIEDDGFWLYESRAIIRYLDEKLDGTRLTPSTLKDRALMEQWISVETSNFTPHAMGIIYEKFFAPMRGAQPDLARVDRALPPLTHALEVMDKQLGKTEYIAGQTFTLADVSFMPYVEYLFPSGHGELITGPANVSRWWNQVSNRRSWQITTGKGK